MRLVPRLLLVMTTAVMLLPGDALPSRPPPVRVLSLTGAVTPAMEEYICGNLREAARSGDSLVLMETDTPGGLDASMRGIIKEMLATPVPVAVYVTPPGARAASAGTIIALAADFTAMAPGTTVGAAHPVRLEGGQDPVLAQKSLNDAVAYAESLAARKGRNPQVAARMVTESLALPAEEAVRSGIADIIAPSRAELLAWLEGRAVVREGKSRELRIAGAPVVLREMTPRQKLLATVSHPDIAYILLMLGYLGLFFELANPGVILPGVIGAISLVLALFGLQSLPVNYAGSLLILLALILFVAEIKVVSHGILAIGGTVSLVLGSMLLFDSPEPYLRVSLPLILATVVLTAGFSLFVVRAAIRAQRKKPVTGAEGLVGERGTAVTDLDTSGKVFVRGEYWDAHGDDPIRQGEEIEVTEVHGMVLRVRKPLPE